MQVYTFRTFPGLRELEKEFPNLFVFGSLKSDLEKFKLRLQTTRPSLILGVARSDAASRIESVAVNRFGKGNRVTQGGRDSYPLEAEVWRETFPVATNATHSFCNWTMYKLCEFIEREGLPTRLSFVHLNPSELDVLISSIYSKINSCHRN